jgi:hypothetical protein
MMGKLITFFENGWDFGTIWQKCQVLVSVTIRNAESSDSVAITQQYFQNISLAIPLHNAFISSYLLPKSFDTSLSNQYKHTLSRALGNLLYSFINLKAKGV